MPLYLAFMEYNRIMDFTENDRRYHNSTQHLFAAFFRFPYSTYNMHTTHHTPHTIHSRIQHKCKMIEENRIRRAHTVRDKLILVNVIEWNIVIIFAFINL